jgi:hypothetical protein
MTVQGIPGEYYDLTFGGSKGYADQPLMTISHDLQAKKGKTASVNFSTFSLRDLLGNNDSTDLLLEIELTEAGERTTVVQNACTVSEELIDSQALEPSALAGQMLAVCASDVSMQNSTTLQAITGMTFSVITGGQYWVEGILAIDAAMPGTGIKFGFTGITASDVYALSQYRIAGNSSSRNDFETTLNPIVEFVETTSVGAIALNMTFTADTGGTMQLGFAQSVAGSAQDAELRKGSSLRLTKMS